MAEKKIATEKVAKKTAEKKVSAKATPKKTVAKKVASTSTTELYINAESVGFRAGDVYQALAGTENNLTVEEISKIANISKDEVLLGLGWLFKEGKVVGNNIADLHLA